MIGFEAKFFVGFNGVEPLVLQFISPKLGNQADSATFLLLVKQDPRTGLSNHSERQLELLATVAA